MPQTSTTLTREEYIFTKYRQMPSASSLVIIDSSVDDLELLKTGLKPGAEVVVLHPQFKGIEQITALVSRRKNLQKVHLVSHGSSGSLKLGASELNSNNIDKYSCQLKSWFGNCGDSISLFVYGCQVAANDRGKSFVRKLHQLTRANIAASTRTVGSPTNDGVWQLDYSLGQVNAELAFSNEVIQTYSGIFQDEEPLEEAEDSSPLTNFEGGEIQVQIFAPDLESPTSDPITAVVSDGIEFDDDLPPSDNPGDNLFPANVDIDLAGGVAGEGSIFFEVDEDQTPDTFISGDFNGYVFTDISGNLPAIENVALNESSNTLGLEPDDVTFSENTIEVNVESLVAEPGFTALLDVEFGEPETESEPVTETTVEEEPVAEEPEEGEPIEEPGTESEPVTETPVEEESVVEVPVTMTNDTIDLSNVAEGDTVLAMFDVDREADFDNTVDFYEVNADGSVVDLGSGETIAVEQEGYTEAALANRLGLDLATENGVTSEFSTELEGGKIYAPFIAVDSSIEALTDDNPHNDSTIYFTYAGANTDGFDHVRSSESNVFEFEDLPNGGDMDFDDVVVGVSLDSAGIPEAPAEEPVVEEPVEEVPAEEPVEEVLTEEPSTGEELPDFGDVNQEISLQILYPDGETNILEVFAEDTPPERSISFAVTEFSPETAGNNTPGSEQFEETFPDVAPNGFDVNVIASNTISIENPSRVANDTIDLSGINSYTYVISDVSGTLPAIENVAIDPASNLEVEPDDISFTEDSISVNLGGITGEPQTAALLNVDFAGDGGFVSADGSENFVVSNEQYISELGF